MKSPDGFVSLDSGLQVTFQWPSSGLCRLNFAGGGQSTQQGAVGWQVHSLSNMEHFMRSHVVTLSTSCAATLRHGALHA
eukprot:1152704-Pelagomonas_calceolata.AAC.2